jgi:ferric-dicitrate binding protein FerR (iron transport regulator)
MITAGHVGVLSPIGVPRVRAVADLTPYLAWAGGRLVFRDTPLRDVVTELSRWYGIDMRIADARIGRRVYTASFQDEPVSEVQRALEIALDVRAERQGNVVVLRARRANTGR